jgi:type III pantothenate kinase
MRLLIDLGNSRVKWALTGDGGWRAGAHLHRGHDVGELLDQVWGAWPTPVLAVIASVAAAETCRAFEAWIEARWHARMHRVEPRLEQLGVVSRYREPRTLGADRWAALIGARGELPDAALAVVSCGTAVTVDALARDGEFPGGVIFPGLGLQRDALARGTAGIGAAVGDETSCLARSTADAVAAGTVYGVAGAIERVCREFERALGETPKLLITGGDADHIAAHLLRPARRVPDLVLKGLERIAVTL